MSLDEFVAKSRPPNLSGQAARKEKAAHPKGWEPGVVFDGKQGTVVATTATNDEPDWADVFAIFDMDPTRYRIVGLVQIRTWDQAVGNGEVRRVFYHKANFDLIDPDEVSVDVEALIREVVRHKPRKTAPPTGEMAFVVPIADVQLGKGDGDGVEGTTERFLHMIDSVRARYVELRKMGRTFGTLVVADIGDSTEGCYGNYPGQQFMVELNQRDQDRLFRRLFVAVLKVWAPDFEQVVVTGVPSNHAENRQGGKRATDDADDRGLANLEVVAEVFAENPAAYGHVSFVIPDDEMVVVLDCHGTTVAFTHSHKAMGGGLPQAKVKSWWASQAFSEQPAGDAEVLVTGHYHHLSVVDHGPKLHVQCPAMDGGSKWWMDSTGARSRSGVVTFACGGGVRLTDLQVA